MSEDKPSYQKELKARVDAEFHQIVDAEREKIYVFVRDAALESFKNGLAKGRRRSA
ncbi:MAG: hypothetical protein HKN10_05335 [Myxococcales bacterium]|nr:hypothetical protein [Myxococcales bacterium]